jgi:hypothetical protein
MALKLNIDFTYSSRGFDRFRRHPVLNYRTINGEFKSVIEEEVSAWKMGVLPSL